MTNGWNPPQGGNNWGQPQQPQQPQQQGAQPAPGFQAPPIGGVPPQQPGYAQNPFQGLTSGDPASARNPGLSDGSFKLKIHAVKFVQSRAGKALYIIESDILESNNPMSPPGLRVSSFIDMSNMDTRGRHIASFITAVHGYDPTTLPKDSPTAPWTDPQTNQNMGWDHYALQSVQDTNPWAGREVGVNVRTIKTQAGRDFSLHSWVPAQGLVIPPAQPAAPVAEPQQAAAQPPTQAQAPQGNWNGPPNQGGNWGGGQGR